MTDEPKIPEKGGLAIGLGGATTIMYALLPALLVVGIWTLISIYAIVKWVGSAPDHVNPVVIVLGVAGLVTTFVVLIAVATGLIGRGMNPKKREKDGRR
jgi:hypothetical protein